ADARGELGTAELLETPERNAPAIAFGASRPNTFGATNGGGHLPPEHVSRNLRWRFSGRVARRANARNLGPKIGACRAAGGADGACHSGRQRVGASRGCGTRALRGASRKAPARRGISAARASGGDQRCPHPDPQKRRLVDTTAG